MCPHLGRNLETGVFKQPKLLCFRFAIAGPGISAPAGLGIVSPGISDTAGLVIAATRISAPAGLAIVGPDRGIALAWRGSRETVVRWGFWHA